MQSSGGRGRIRTSVARKERQIYSLLVLATHPPVRTGKQNTPRPGSSSLTEDTRASICITLELALSLPTRIARRT
jgi:hypothetical protein